MPVFSRLNITNIKYINIVIILFVIKLGYSQGLSDTIENVKALRTLGHYEMAKSILVDYSRLHSDDLNVLWLLGNTAYVLKDYNTAQSNYEKAIRLFPGQYLLKVDYAKILTSISKLGKARELLRSCLQTNPDDQEAAYYLAMVYYWEVRYKEAEDLLRGILDKNPDHIESSQLLERIRENRSPILKAGVDFIADDQPLLTIIPGITGEMYTQPFHELRLKVQSQLFISDTINTEAFELSAGNQFILNQAGLGIYVEAGIFNHPGAGTKLFTGHLKLDRTFWGIVSLSAGIERNPYYRTLTAATKPLAENHSYLSVTVGKDEKWQCKAGFDESFYPTDNSNSIITLYSWMISPSVRTGFLNWRAGYGCNFSNAAENRFEPKRTIENMIEDSMGTVEGVYKPYFTPKNLQVHSLFGLVSTRSDKSLLLQMKITYGFYATASNPYLFLDNDNEGNLTVRREFDTVRLNPWEIDARFTWKAGRKISLEGIVKIFHTLYYDNQFAGISIRKIF